MKQNKKILKINESDLKQIFNVLLKEATTKTQTVKTTDYTSSEIAAMKQKGEGLNVSINLLKYRKDGKQCILNGQGTENMPNCIDYIMKYYNKQSIDFCSPSMSSYFENNAEKKKGCTRGELNETLTGPRTSTQPKCIIYANEEDNQYLIDSCLNQKELEEYQCFGSNCSKKLIQFGQKTPLLLSINFSDSNDMPHTAYSKKSIIRYLNAVRPEWSKRMNIDKMIENAEVAKKLYIDKTISRADLQ
jgi:hypothetical protein